MLLKIDKAIIYPWLNAAEREIKELKKGSNRKLIKSGAPKKLWDDCFKFHIWPNSTHGIYKLDAEVTKVITSGEASNISQFCEFEWFEWLMF